MSTAELYLSPDENNTGLHSIEESMESFTIAFEALTNINSSVKNSFMSNKELNMVTHSVNGVLSMCGIDTAPVVSLESSDKYYNRRVALEGIGSAVAAASKAFWEAIKKFLKMIKDLIMGLFRKRADSAQAEKVEKAVAKVVAEPEKYRKPHAIVDEGLLEYFTDGTGRLETSPFKLSNSGYFCALLAESKKMLDITHEGLEEGFTPVEANVKPAIVKMIKSLSHVNIPLFKKMVFKNISTHKPSDKDHPNIKIFNQKDDNHYSISGYNEEMFHGVSYKLTGLIQNDIQHIGFIIYNEKKKNVLPIDTSINLLTGDEIVKVNEQLKTLGKAIDKHANDFISFSTTIDKLLLAIEKRTIVTEEELNNPDIAEEAKNAASFVDGYKKYFKNVITSIEKFHAYNVNQVLDFDKYFSKLILLSVNDYEQELLEQK